VYINAAHVAPGMHLSTPPKKWDWELTLNWSCDARDVNIVPVMA